MSYNPKTGLVYLPTMQMGGRYVAMGLDPSWRAVDFEGGTGVGVQEILVDEDLPPGLLQAWDPVKQQPAWQVPQKHPWNAGTLSTSELVLQGRYDGVLLALPTRMVVSVSSNRSPGTNCLPVCSHWL